MKINGWQRLGIVVFLLWSAGISIYWWSEVNINAKIRAEYDRKSCESQNKSLNDQIDCWGNYHKQFLEIRQSALKNGRWELPVIILWPPLAILLTWIFSYGTIRIFYWIMRGFSKEEKRPFILKKSFILTISIVIFFILFTIASNIYKSQKRKSFDVTVAQCELDAFKLELNDTDHESYIKTCMKTNGYSFNRYREFCNDPSIYSAASYSCYE